MIIYLIVIPLLYLASRKIVVVLKPYATRIPWYASALVHTIVFFYVIELLLIILNFWIYTSVRQFVFFFDFSSYYPLYGVFIGPVIFYEWYWAQRDSTDRKPISVLWFILLPAVVLLVLSYLGLRATTGLGGFLYLMAIPLEVAMVSVWIFWRDRTSQRIAN